MKNNSTGSSSSSSCHHEPSESTPSLSSVPDEIAANCLARVSKSQYCSISSVNKGFYSLLSSREIYAARSEIGATEPRLYLCCESLKTGDTRCWYNLTSLDDDNKKGDAFISIDGAEIKIKTELRLVPVKDSSFHLRARSNEANLAVGSDIYQIGGINNKGKRSRSVCVLDCLSHTQRRAPRMRVARQCAKACLLDGSIYVMGGTTRSESWGEVFDLKSQTWKKDVLLPSPPIGDCNFQLLVLGSRIHVITEHNKYYAYDPKQGRWLLLLDTRFVGLKSVLELGTVWCVLDNLVFKELGSDLFWYDLSCGKWLLVEGLEDLCYTRVNCCYCMIQLLNYGGKLMIVWLVLPEPMFRRNKPPVIQEEKTCFALIRLEKRLTSSGLAISGVIERLSFSLVHGSYNPLTCLSVLL
ncbi:F-box domain-containing protein [Hirschfeldia incana]|nr:F-box domain-containing protein [Hirschfeldia incana]